MRSTCARIGVIAAFTLLLVAPAASAETFKKTYGGTEEATFAWEGMATGLPSWGVGVGIKNGCATADPVFRCDLVIFDVKEAGLLEAAITMDTAPTCDPVGVTCDVDIDIFLYKSDAAGTHGADDPPIAEAATAEQTESLKAKVKPGFYVLEVEPYNGRDVTYKGTSKFTSDTPPAPPAPVVTDPPPAPAPPPAPPAPAPAPAPQPVPSEPMTVEGEKPAKTGKRAACRKKAKKVKNARKRKKALKACSRKPV